MALTIKTISAALNISRSRVEQWIARGQFRTPQVPVLGKARDWNLSDALRLAIMDQLLSRNLTAETAGRLVWLDPHGFKDDVAFFVAWTGWQDMAGGGKMHLEGEYLSEIVPGRELATFLGNPDVEYSIVINLDTFSDSVLKRLKEAGADGSEEEGCSADV